jgi:hypothetical protein
MAEDPKDVERCKPQFAASEKPLRHQVCIPGRRSGQSLALAAAVQHAITSNVLGPGVQPPRSLLDELRKRGTPLMGLTIRGVGPEHEHCPGPKQFNVVGNVCYVRDEDFPKLQAALERQRALRRGPSEPIR